MALRTFALAVGLTNYSYLPLPLMNELFGPESRAVLFLHNAGLEAAIWTGGVLVVTGLSPTKGWRKLLNAPVIALAVALLVNLAGLGPHVPDFLRTLIHSLAVLRRAARADHDRRQFLPTPRKIPRP